MHLVVVRLLYPIHVRYLSYLRHQTCVVTLNSSNDLDNYCLCIFYFIHLSEQQM